MTFKIRYVDRNRAIIARYNAGADLDDIAFEFRLGRERVRQILRASGISTSGLPEAVQQVGFYTKIGSVVPQPDMEATAILLDKALKRRNAFTPEERERRAKVVITLYENGVPLHEIAVKADVPYSTISRIVRKRGRPARHRAWTPEEKAAILARNEEPASAIAAEYGATVSSISGLRRRDRSNG